MIVVTENGIGVTSSSSILVCYVYIRTNDLGVPSDYELNDLTLALSGCRFKWRTTQNLRPLRTQQEKHYTIFPKSRQFTDIKKKRKQWRAMVIYFLKETLHFKWEFLIGGR